MKDDSTPPERAVEEVRFIDSNRIGKFSITAECLNDGRERPMLQALFGLCVIIQAYPHESGRGTTYIAASELFQGLAEGEEIPEYRIKAWPGPAEHAPGPDEENECTPSGAFRFRAIRNIIVRVPLATARIAPVPTGTIH